MDSTPYLSPIGLWIQNFTNQGVILAGGQIATYVAGTTTPVATYTDNTLTVANANPIILDASGRLPASVWIPQGTTVKAVIMDAASNVLATIDNLAGINDITSALSSLANPASGQGVDLVANANRSYANFAAMRQANEPDLLSGQTLIVIAEGQTTVNDGLGGAFYWSTSSTAADDNFLVIQPTGVATGRYLRLTSPTTGPLVMGTGTSTAYALGTNGTGTIPSANFVGVTGNARGLVASVIAGSPNPTMTITAQELSVETAAGLYLTLKAVNVAINPANAGANGLDTGTVADNTWYSHFIIYNASTATTAGLLSLSATAPTLPSGYAYVTRTGAVLTNGSAQLIGTIQHGRAARYIVGGPNCANLPIVAGGSAAIGDPTTPTWVAQAVAPFVPPTAISFAGALAATASSGSATAILAPNNSYGAYNSTTNAPPVGYSGGPMIVPFEMMLETTNLYLATDQANIFLLCSGWEDS